jgi:hypothetical protein
MYTPFGQNRVQYGLFDWQFIRSENFDAYFYSGGREIAQFAARTAETELNEVERLIDHRLSSRIEVICYNSHSDYKQSNFGLADNPTNTGGTSQISSNKISLALLHRSLTSDSLIHSHLLSYSICLSRSAFVVAEVFGFMALIIIYFIIIYYSNF